jgi:K(+)-stimulated pyrophosphate-energized sodium pump
VFYKADVLAALFVGGMIPFIFSSLAIRAVGEAAMAMVEEVRRQFRTIPGIMEGTGKPEYDKCVAISTEASLKKMMLPGAITIISPILIGFTMGPEALGGFLAGATVSGVLMGIFQNNAGGAWDNAKKSFEKGVEINGEMFYKKSEPHKASVTGDTVGDPFKDTSGPSMNILIKLMSIVSLVIAPSLAQLHPTKAIEEIKSQKVEIAVFKTDSSANMTDSSTTVTITADTKTLVQALIEDNLAPKDNVNIQIKDGKITVNGKALTDEQNAKYATYLQKK